MLNKQASTFILAISLILILVTSALPLHVEAAPTGLFEINMIAPGTANQARRQWAQIVRNAMQQVGIDASVAYLGWGAVFDRVFFAPSEIWNKSFKEGGYDAIFIGQGWTIAIPTANPKAWGYYGDKKFFPPGPNFWFFNDAQSNKLMDDYLRTLDANKRIDILKEWQKYMQQNGPDFTIEYDVAHYAFNPRITGFDPMAPYRSQNLGGVTSITYASPGELTAFNNVLSFSWYDIPHIYAVNDLTVDYDFAAKKPVFVMVESVTPSADGLQWTFKIRQGMRWHTGVEVTADDFVFGSWIQFTPETGSQGLGYFTDVLGDRVTLKWLNGSTTVKDFTPTGAKARVGAVEAVDKYTVRYTIPETYAIFGDEFPFGVLAYPKHALESIPAADWGSHPFNTGEGTYKIKLPDGTTKEWAGPVGSGPYIFKSWDRTKQLVTLEKNPNYWNRAALEAQGKFSASVVKVVYISEKEPAMAALKNKEVDFLDFNYHFQKDLARFDPSWAKIVESDLPGLQELGLSMNNPVWGTGTATPVGKADPAKAKEAANHVRRALDHLIPRKLIIDNLLDGFGKLGVTWVKPYEIGFDTTLKPTEYSLDEARKHLALAGYKVGVTPTVSWTPPTIGAVTPGPVAVPTLLAGTPIILQGKFINATSGLPFAISLKLDVQASTDEGKTWKKIAETSTDDYGNYQAMVVPAEKGTYWYRVYFAGNTLSTDEWVAIVGRKLGILGFVQLLPPLWSDPVKVQTGSLSDVVSQLATGKSVTDLSQQVKTAVDQLGVQLTKVTADTTRLRADATASSKQISDLQAQVATLTTGLYAAIALIIIVGAAGFYFARRKS